MENTITNVTISPKSERGYHAITGIVNGQPIEAHTFNSEVFNYFDSENVELRENARLYCEVRLEQAYNRLNS